MSKSFSHWSDGGDGITNFRSTLHFVYERAIKEYGDRSLYIGPSIPDGNPNRFALRCIRCHNRDLTAFWRIYERVRKDFRIEKL